MVKSSGLLMAAGVILVFAAFALTVYNIYDAERAAERAQTIIENMQTAEVNGIEDNSELIQKYPNMEMPTKEVDGVRVIGTIDIQSIDVSLPVIKEWSYESLKAAPCRYSGSVYNNDCIIAAHNYPRHFGRLKSLKKGDEVVFTDVVGNVFYYNVEETIELDGGAVDEMKSSGYDLTLFTCNKSGTLRVTVGCSQKK